MASAGKRADRATTEGLVATIVNGTVGTIVGVGCETEPVSNNDDFLAFAERVLETVWTDGVGAEQALDEERQELAARLGENVVVVEPARFEALDGGVIDAYVHPPANKLGVLVQLRGGDATLAHSVALHIAAAAPQWIGRDDVPEDVVAAELDIYRNSDELEGKPEQAKDKIVEGMLNKRFYAQQVLADQQWIHDGGKTVADALKEAGAEVVEFERISLAG
jgi:elongation factor Ts